MTPKKMYYLLTAGFVLLFVAIGALMYFSRVFLKANSDELVSAKLELYKIDETENTYKRNQALLEEYADTANILAAIVPAEKDQAKAVREITQIAAENGLKVMSVSFPQSDLNRPATTGTKTGSTPSATVSVSQARAITGLTGVLGLEINVELSTPDGSPISTDQLLGYLQQIENNRRNMRITSISYSADSEKVNIKALLFIKP